MNVIACLRSIFRESDNPVPTPRTPCQELDFLVSKFNKKSYGNDYYINEMRPIYFKQLKLIGWKPDNYDVFRFKKNDIELEFWASVTKIILSVSGYRITVYYQGQIFVDGNWIHGVIQDLDTVIRASTNIVSERKANLRQEELLEQAIVNRV